MPYTHEWLVEGRVLYSRVIEPYTDDEIETSSEVAAQMLSAATTPTYFIVNALGLKTFPHNVVRTTNSLKKFIFHPNLHQLLVISDNSAIRFVALLATTVQRSKLLMYTTPDAAFAYIAKQAPGIADEMSKPTA